jgi:S-adenosylmethionine hydrolase
MKALISFLTDFGRDDEYVAVMKAVIKSINPDAEFIDISNGVSPWDIKRAAYMIGYSYAYFPDNTVHIIVVDPGVGSKRGIICARTSKHTFIAPDNGVLSVVLNKEPEAELYNVSSRKYMLPTISSTFHGRDIFAPVAAHISNGVPLNKIGKKVRSVKRIDNLHPILEKNRLTGEVVYSDRFGNLITNIDSATFTKFVKTFSKPFKIRVGKTTVNNMVNFYDEVKNNCPFAIFGSKGLMEISVKKGSAKSFFGEKGKLAVEVSYSV